MASSVDGKTTRGEEPSIYHWTSKEDKAYFFKLLEKQKIIIMGRNTYEAARSIMKLSPKTLRIVMTKNPERFAKKEIKGQLEFSSEKPSQLIKRLEKKGYSSAMLISGEIINGIFLEEKLINEIYLTIEPALFGKGKNMIIVKDVVQTQLHLKDIKKLNSQGTLLLHYLVL